MENSSPTPLGCLPESGSCVERSGILPLELVERFCLSWGFRFRFCLSWGFRFQTGLALSNFCGEGFSAAGKLRPAQASPFKRQTAVWQLDNTLQKSTQVQLGFDKRGFKLGRAQPADLHKIRKRAHKHSNLRDASSTLCPFHTHASKAYHFAFVTRRNQKVCKESCDTWCYETPHSGRCLQRQLWGLRGLSVPTALAQKFHDVLSTRFVVVSKRAW